MSILDTKITDRGASGQRDLLPAGTYKNVEIKNLEEMELNERDRENNNIARLRCDMVDLDCGQKSRIELEKLSETGLDVNYKS